MDIRSSGKFVCLCSRAWLFLSVFGYFVCQGWKAELWTFEKKRHWPIGLLYDCHTVSLSASSSSQSVPLRMTLHLASPPVDKLLLSPSPEACKQAFMGQLKEADFLRWGSTKRVTGLRKAEQDGIWEGIKERGFATFVYLETARDP